jgi:glucosamine-6-phosphate deaminase
MNIVTYDSVEILNEAAAAVITGVVQLNPQAVLGMATGGTQIDVYRNIVQTFRRGLVSFREVTTFNLDEYVGLPEDHLESYRHYMKEHLFDHVDFNAGNTHIPNGNAKKMEDECSRYDGLIRKAGGIDLQLLGIGHNGHIGFNEPAGELFSQTHLVELAEETRAANGRYFASPCKVPKQALTMGVGTILKAKKILLIVKGEDKADIFARALTGSVTTECPASLLQLHPHLIVLADGSASKYLNRANA